MYVLAVGNPFDGVDLIGPFVDYTDATDYAAFAYPNSSFTVENVITPDQAIVLRTAVEQNRRMRDVEDMLAGHPSSSRRLQRVIGDGGPRRQGGRRMERVE